MKKFWSKDLKLGVNCFETENSGSKLLYIAHIPSGAKINIGVFGQATNETVLTAPNKPGFYNLWEYGDKNNCHICFRFEEETVNYEDM